MNQKDLLPIQKTVHDVIYADALTALKTFEDNSFDLVIADPPYNIISKNQTKLIKDHGLKTMGGEWKIFDESWDKDGLGEYLTFTLNYLKEVKRVLKPFNVDIWNLPQYRFSKYMFKTA